MGVSYWDHPVGQVPMLRDLHRPKHGDVNVSTERGGSS